MKKITWSLILFGLFSLDCNAVVPTNEQRICKSNDDCIVWDGACCGCVVSGAKQQFGVNKKFHDKLQGQKIKECSGGGCGAGNSLAAQMKCQSLNVNCSNQLCEVK